MKTVAQVYVGTDPRMGKAERVLEHSLRQNATVDVRIHWMRSGDPGFGDWLIGRKPGRPYSGGSWSTDFSCFRFGVPELAGFRGRAIYLDVDMLVLGDIRELWERRIRKPWTCAGRRTEVSIIDCDAFEHVDWWPRLARMKRDGLHLGDYWTLLSGHGRVDVSLPDQWNVLDRWTEDAKLIHFTNMETQPWKPWPEAFAYRPHRDPKAEQLFWDEYRAAIAKSREATSSRPSEVYSGLYRERVDYAMRPWRQEAFVRYLRELKPKPRSLLDVGCGRGESMEIARAEGIEECRGAEIVTELCGKNVTHLAGGATDLPFGDRHFDLVTAMDVLEHLAEEEVAQAVREAWRVARHRVFFGIPHKQDNLGLHLTVRDRAWWHACLVEVAGDEDRVIVIDLPIPSHKQPHTFFELRKQERSTD